MKNILIALGLIIIVVVVAGIYRFNFTNDDMYIQLPSGEVIVLDDMDTRDKNRTLMTIPKAEFEAKYLAMKGGGAQIVDVRTEGEYAQGHYEGATMIDFYATDFKERLNALDKEVPYFIHCRSGSRSGQALNVMRDLGFTQVYDLAGGFANAQDILTIVK